jgi:hypothetical protein
MEEPIMRSILVLGLLALSAPPALAQYYLPAYQYSSPADLQNEVANWYRRFLHREPDPQGLAGWVQGLASGNPPEKILSGILGSAEYYVPSGNTPDGFIRHLYQDLLGRQPTEQELAYWLGQMYSGDRNDVAYRFLMRYPESWQAVPSVAVPATPPLAPATTTTVVPVPTYNWRYEYRRPFWHPWHQDWEHHHHDEHHDRR